MRYWGELLILSTIIVLGMLTLYSSNDITNIVPGAPKHPSATLEHAHAQKHALANSHITLDTKVVEPITNPVPIVKRPKRLFVLTTGERAFKNPSVFSVNLVHGTKQAGVFAATFDEGFGPKDWPEGAKRVAEGHVTIWKRVAAECSGWCFVSEDDAIWPDALLPAMPPHGFVSYFVDAVCDAATRPYSGDYRQVVKAVVRGRCMPYGAVAYALTQTFAKTLLNALPMDKPVDHFLWEQAVKHHMGFVARDFLVKHAHGKSLRESVVKSHDDSEYIMYKDVDQIGFDIGGAPIVSAREFCSKRRDCMAYNHMGWAKSSLNHVQSVRGVHLYVKRKHALSSFRAGVAEQQPPVHTNCDFEMNEPVDVVYTWVNWTAPAYVAQMRKHGILYGEHKESHMNYEKTSDDSSYEELRYSMSSLLKHGGNIGKIYVVINPIHGPPAWLDTSHPNVEIVHHSKILPNVPTNNAWAIVTAIHRIPGLSKWFLALNDDVILNKNLEINSRLIQCPRSELQYSHCPTLRNTCLMHALEKHFEARVQKVFDYRKKSTTSYMPDVVLWLEHHNWMVTNGHATYEPDSNWFGLVNTNAWQKDSNWVNRRWGQVLKKAERSMWINFQGQGISWEYPENEAIRRQYNSWIAVRGYDKHFAAMRKKKEMRESAKVQRANVGELEVPNKYVVVMPSVKRNNNQYLKQTLASLHDAKPRNVPVIFVNANQPPEEHLYLIEWCNNHQEYQCRVPPKVPESLVQQAIREDQRGDTEKFLRWRTHETFHARFALKNALEMNTEYIIWIQDDTIVDKQMFSKLKDGDIYCLNSGPEYCGAVAYLFSRSFVEYLIPKIESKMISMPIDWIIYDPFSTEAVSNPLKTIPLVRHIGRLSSKNIDLSAKADSLAVAVPVYNRIGYAKLCAAALKDTISSKYVYVFDDHSTEFSVDDLKKWFSTSNVRRNEVRLKADKQARAIMEWFVTTEYDWLVTLDSDLIVRPDWLTIFEKHVSQTQGVVSLYHSGNIKNHPTGACTGGLCEMRSLGNAGVAWSRPLATRMLSEMKYRDGFDWGWTEWLQKQGIPQYAFEDSLVLHIGMHGTWGVDSKREKSKGFDMSTLSEDIRVKVNKYLEGMRPDTNNLLKISIQRSLVNKKLELNPKIKLKR